MHEVVVTGIGIVSPIGIGVSNFKEQMFSGASGLVDIRGLIVDPDFPVSAAGLVRRHLLPRSHAFSGVSAQGAVDSWRFAAVATEEAIETLPKGESVDAIVYGTDGGIQFEMIRDSVPTFDTKDFPWEATRAEAELNLIRQLLAERGIGCPDERHIICINNACVTGNQAVGIAFRRIRSGQWTRALVGGVYARCTVSNLMKFHMLGALCTNKVPAMEASQPFSKGRAGFVRGDGAATLVLEARSEAERRGAAVLGSVVGYAATTDAYRLTDEHPEARGAIQAMTRAILDANLTTGAISAISAHGTSTQMNDRIETLAIKKVFGSRAYAVPVVSLKSQVGHSAIAAGALEAVASLLMLSEQRLAPTINYKEFDPDCDLDYVPNRSRPCTLEYVLSNNFGFGGQNACVIFAREAR
jgi:3-oxoacyl-[acyl-carrier-protein] synthase II